MRKISAKRHVIGCSILAVLVLTFSVLFLSTGAYAFSLNNSPAPTNTPQPDTICSATPTPPPGIYCTKLENCAICPNEWVFDPGAIPAYPNTNYSYRILNALPFAVSIADDQGFTVATIQPDSWAQIKSGPGLHTFTVSQPKSASPPVLEVYGYANAGVVGG